MKQDTFHKGNFTHPAGQLAHNRQFLPFEPLLQGTGAGMKYDRWNQPVVGSDPFYFELDIIECVAAFHQCP